MHSKLVQSIENNMKSKSSTERSKPVLLIQNAYSRSNSGDGLLVDLTLAIIRDAIDTDDYSTVVLANDSDSFRDLPNVIQVPCVSRSFVQRSYFSIERLLAVFAFAVFGGKFRYRVLDKSLGFPSIIVGVGGGYMRGAGRLEALKCLINNTSQLLWASGTGAPFVYFPQSIGPFRYRWHRSLVLRGLRKAKGVCCRDDRTYAELDLDNKLRMPDLAVMELARKMESSERRAAVVSRAVLLVCRDLNCSAERRNDYVGCLRQLQEMYGMEVVLQSTGRGNNDQEFCQQVFRKRKFRALQEALRDGAAYLVVSVRLHGAMEALLSGHPAYHLSYERKGFGAFGDLGLSDYVENVYGASPEKVCKGIESILADEDSYWFKVETRVPEILRHRKRLVELTRDNIEEVRTC
jgi:polysaccharide pyruvyl transferase WcaK-like protein